MPLTEFERLKASEIENYIRRFGTDYRGWYAGIACTPRDRLFIDHAVRENGDLWIFTNAVNDQAARNIEQYLLARGCQGGPSGGDSTTCFVYAYRITTATRQAA